MTVPITEWGRDHWSTFAYVETVCVDYGGDPSRARNGFARMRCNPKRHPEYATRDMLGDLRDGSQYPTRLEGTKTLENHDDWDCVDDMVAEGLLEDIGFTMFPRFKLSEKGHEVSAHLRRHKADGGNFSDFSYRHRGKAL